MEFDIHHIEKINSTNRYAFEVCIQKKMMEGSVFVAKEQTDGKGYKQNKWLSDKGKNLTFSLVLQPLFITPSEQFVITQIVSLSVVDLLNELIPQFLVKIKWPNDIYIGNRKVCGILVQHSIVGDKMDFSVVGIGLNINQTIFPEELPNPVSLSQITKEYFDPDEILKKLLIFINYRYELYRKKPGRQSLKKEYMKNLYLFGEQADFKDDTGPFLGQISGVDEYGRLEIMLSDGKRKKYNFKEVKFQTDD